MDDEPSPSWTHVHDGEDSNIVQVMLRNHDIEAYVIPASRRRQPSVWVLAPDAPRAIALIEEMRNVVEHPLMGTWLCRCGEICEAQFDRCWKCGKERAV
jgi:hypothetical protein